MAMNNITKEDVLKIATLAKLDVTGDEERLAQMFSETLDYIEILNELDTSNTPETFQVTGLTNVFQDGNQTVTLTKEEVLSNAPEVIDGLISNKGVFNRE